MKRKEINIKQLAHQLAELEKGAQAGDSEKIKEMEKLVLGLSFEDMIRLDEYILEHKLLSKSQGGAIP